MKIFSSAYKYMTADKERVKKLRRIDAFFRKKGGRFYAGLRGKLKYKLRYKSNPGVIQGNGEKTFETLCWAYDKKIKMKDNPLVSVIVPNYNHAKYLKERLDSVYQQTYRNLEVILMDDCSTDDSREILQKYAEMYPEQTITMFNESNSGKVFGQWNKGIAAAKGELIWIAESDDSCDLNFLEEMVKSFEYRSVILAFARSVFMQDGIKVWSTEEHLGDLPNLRWDVPFYMSANDLVENGFALRNLIPNVSSVVFRNIGKIPEDAERICEGMKLCGDWIFYLGMMKGSVVAYTNATTNYYRIHEQSTSLKVQKTIDYYQETEAVSLYVARNYNVREEVYKTVFDKLKEHYSLQEEEIEDFDLDRYYSIDKIRRSKEERDPVIVMADYALLSSGGETYPIHLANELKRQGKTVTLLNFDFEQAEERIEELIDISVPVVYLKESDLLGQVLQRLGCEVIHSHHASIDHMIALWIKKNPELGKHIITLHGMYEAIDAIDPEDCTRTIQATMETCSKYIYIADKNLDCFRNRNLYDADKFVKMDNGLPNVKPQPIERRMLGIDEEDCVCVLASRGVKEKGWKEAIDAVNMANQDSKRRIHLVILGDGDYKKELESMASDTIHFMGVVTNVRDYFAMCDLGLLPTRFKGESYPLVIIECLQAGKPVVATDIAEVSNQITDAAGNKAGVLVEMHDWNYRMEDFAEHIRRLANSPSEYEMLTKYTKTASEKFDISKVVGEYLKVYGEA